MSCAEIEWLVPCGVTLHIPRDSNDAVRDGSAYRKSILLFDRPTRSVV